MLLALLTLLSVSAPEPARAAITVLYLATDVEDAGAGDRWRYDYVVQGAYLSPGDGLEIRFAFGSYQDLEVLAAPEDWQALALEPDASLGDGAFAAGYAGGGTSDAQPFAAAFVWLGSGSPGAQPFALYDSHGVVIAEATSLPIPEPPSFVLLIAGLLMAGAICRRRIDRIHNG
jgi:hypothetical protein